MPPSTTGSTGSTAPADLGSGRADRVVAEVLRERPIGGRPLIFTSSGTISSTASASAAPTAPTVLRDCEYALKTFQVERIDLFQLRWPTPTRIAEDQASACAELLAAGKIRALGVCNVSPAELAQWQAAGVPLQAVQNAYSVVKPEAEQEVLPWCAAHGVGFLAYSPLQRGLLFGGWSADKRFPPGDHRGERADFRGRRLARYLAAVDELKAIAAADGLEVAELAIGCLMCHEGMTACIVGARTAEQGAYLGRLGMPATKAQLAAVDAVCVRLFADLAAIGEG